MTTIISLNKAFYKAVEDAIDCKKQGQNLVDSEGKPLPVNDSRHDLFKLYETNRVLMDTLEKEDKEARTEILKAFDNKAPGKQQVKKAKDAFKAHHKRVEERLKLIHNEFNGRLLELDNPSVTRILEQLEFAQRIQIKGLEVRTKEDEKQLDSRATDPSGNRDRKFSARLLKTGKASGKHYRVGELLTKKLRDLTKQDKKETDAIGKMGELEMDEAKEFSLNNIAWSKNNQRWVKKEERDAEEAAEINRLGAQSLGGEWEHIDEDNNYLRGEKEITITNAVATGLLGSDVVIRLNVQLDADKKKGTPAADKAIICGIPYNASTEQQIAILNILAHAYRASGWSGVELGHRTPKELWEQAYLACRRVGFSDDQIFFKGISARDWFKTSNPGLLSDGKDARDRIEVVHEQRERTLSTDPEEMAKLDRALAKLTMPMHYTDSGLELRNFFGLPEDEQERLMEQASLDQRAAILADYAFDEKKLEEYMPDTLPTMAEVINLIASKHSNPDRALAVFELIAGDPSNQQQLEKQQKVLNLVGAETAADLLMRLPLDRGEALFVALPFTKKVEILKQPRLPDSVTWSLYTTLSDKPKAGEHKDTERKQALRDLTKNPGHNTKALGAIIAQSFIAPLVLTGNTDQEATTKRMLNVVGRLRYILNSLPSGSEDAAETIIAAVYNALPTEMRIPLQRYTGKRIDFLETLEVYENEGHGSTRAIRNLYEKVNKLNNSGNEKFSDIEINKQKSNLNGGGKDDRNDALDFFNELDSTTIADALRQSDSKDLAAQFEVLVKHAEERAGDKWNEDNAALANVLSLSDHEDKMLEGAKKRARDKLANIAIKLGPTIVGKALAEFKGNKNISGLIDLMVENNEYKILAQALTVFYHAGGCLDDTQNETFANLMLHINHPKLIEEMLKQQESQNIVAILAKFKDETQQAKVFRSLSEGQQIDVHNQYEGNFKQQKAFFPYLRGKGRENYVNAMAKDLAQGRHPEKANQIIACVYDPRLTQKQRKPLLKILDTANLVNIIPCTSKPTAQFFAYCLSSQQAEDQVALFENIMEMKQRFVPPNLQAQAAYLDTVGHALALLDEEQRDELFFRLNSQVFAGGLSASVQASTLIHLVSADNQKAACALFEDKRLQTAAKTALKHSINELAKNYSTKFQQALYEGIGYQHPQLSQSSGQQTPRI